MNVIISVSYHSFHVSAPAATIEALVEALGKSVVVNEHYSQELRATVYVKKADEYDRPRIGCQVLVSNNMPINLAAYEQMERKYKENEEAARGLVKSQKEES